MIYLVVWVIAGVAAYVVGTMWYPGKLQPLTDLGQSWFGLAVAAAYSYFGISPAGGNSSTAEPKNKFCARCHLTALPFGDRGEVAGFETNGLAIGM